MFDHRYRTGLLLAALASGCARRGTIAGVPAGSQPVRLAYGSVPGEGHRWTLDQAWRGSLALNNLPQLVVVKIHGIVAERIVGIGPDGRGRVSLTIEMAPPELNGLPVESDRFPPRSTCAFTRSADGGVEDLTSRESTGDALSWAARLVGGIAPLLPAVPVGTGDRWFRADVRPAPGGGTLTLTTTGELARWEVGPGFRRAVLSVTDRAELADPPAGLGLSALALESAGTVRFDPDAGAVRSAERTGLLTFRGGSGRTSVEGRLRFTTTLAPAPESATAP